MLTLAMSIVILMFLKENEKGMPLMRGLKIIPENKTELDIYLKEGICKPSDENYDEIDALNWWKVNAMKFRCLSKMARDVLSIPITTVASEAAFSAGGRVLDQYRR